MILPEKEFNIDEDIIKPILGLNRGKHHYIVIIAEKVVGGTWRLLSKLELR